MNRSVPTYVCSNFFELPLSVLRQWEFAFVCGDGGSCVVGEKSGGCGAKKKACPLSDTPNGGVGFLRSFNDERPR